MITRQKNGVAKSPWARVNPIRVEDYSPSPPKQAKKKSPPKQADDKPSPDRSSMKDVVKKFKKNRSIPRFGMPHADGRIAPPPRKPYFTSAPRDTTSISNFITEIPKENFAKKSYKPPSIVPRDSESSDSEDNERWSVGPMPDVDITPQVRFTDYLVEAFPAMALGSAAPQPRPINADIFNVPVANLLPFAATPALPAVQQQPATQGSEQFFRYTSDLPLYSTAWSSKSNFVRFAVGTVAEKKNKISLVQFDEAKKEVVEKATIEHDFTINHMQFVPDVGNVLPEILAVSSSTLSLYHIGKDTITPIKVNTSKNISCYDGITSFHWNEVDPKMIATCHLDGLVTIFDVEVRKVLSTNTPLGPKSQLVAHDSTVYDIEFSGLYGGKNHFATVGRDGTCRAIDIRSMDTTTVLYADPQKRPLMRISWSRRDPYLFATFAQNSSQVAICDMRVPGKSLYDLNNHIGCVNGIAWAPNNPRNLCTVGDDGRALIWNLDSVRQTAAEKSTDFSPVSQYEVQDQISQVRWSTAHPGWVNVVYGNSVDLLSVGGLN